MLPTDLLADIMEGMPQHEALLLMDPLRLRRAFSAGEIDIKAGPAAAAEKAGYPIQKIGSTAVVPVIGMTNKRYRVHGFLASYIATSVAMRAAAADSSVRTIVLKIDSPGGFVTGVAEAADDIYEVAQTKPVVASIDGLGASAAYWLASQATRIYAGRMDEVGSIGVLAVLYDLSKMFDEAGIKAEVFSTGKYKWAGVPGTAITDDQRKHIQGLVDAVGDAFVADIARGRRMSEANVKEVADGRVFMAADAVKYGLIDGIKTFAQVVNDIEEAERRERRIRAGKLDTARADISR